VRFASYFVSGACPRCVAAVSVAFDSVIPPFKKLSFGTEFRQKRQKIAQITRDV
jgi:hypothetical protein